MFRKQHGLIRFITASLVVMGGAVCLLSTAQAQEGHQNLVTIKAQEGYRYIISNGLPVQDPLGASSQRYTFRVSLTPRERDKPGGVPKTMYFGVGLDGVPFDTYAGNMNTDEYGGLVLEGKYIYGDVPRLLLEKDLSHVGYAADGVPIFYSQKNLFKTSYDSKNTYVPGSGNLDVCNGVTVNNKYYIYVLTGEYPRIPLCWTREPDASFYKPGIAPPKPSPTKAVEGFNYQLQKNKSSSSFVKENRKARGHN